MFEILTGGAILWLLSLIGSGGGGGNDDSESANLEPDFEPGPVPRPLVPDEDEDEALDIRPGPTPGSWYRIEKGDTLFAISSRAYGTSGPANLAAAKRISNNPWNEPFMQQGDPNGLMGSMWIRGAFFPDWACGQNLSDIFDHGSCYGTIYIPNEG